MLRAVSFRRSELSTAISSILGGAPVAPNYNSRIQCHDFQLAGNVFAQMKNKNFDNETINLNIMINFYGKVGDRSHTNRVLSGFERAGIKYDKKAFDSLRSLYTDCGNKDGVALINEFADAAKLM